MNLKSADHQTDVNHTDRITEALPGNILLVVLSSLLLTFTFCIFGPLELYISNIEEFWFSIGDLWLVWICGAVVFGVLAGTGVLLKGKARSIYIAVIIGLALALYLQGNFINANYGVLDDREIDWESYGAVGILNTLIWLVCIAAPLALLLWKKDIWKKVVKYVSICIVLVQAATLGYLLISTDLGKDNSYLSAANIDTVSDSGDIVIFVLDTFDEDYFLEILEEDPGFVNPLDGFTFFQNATGMYPTTKGALPYILTGQYYENDIPYSDYIRQAYQNTDYYDDLKKNGYNINLYTSGLFVSNRLEDGVIRNLEKHGRIVSSYVDLAKAAYQLTAFTYFPHYLKPGLVLYSGTFDNLQAADPSKPKVFSYGNASYVSSMQKSGLQLSDDEKIYKMIHLSGVHAPYTFSEDMHTVDEGTVTALQNAKGCLNIIYEYIRQLKELGVYDSTTIIVTADHGNVLGYPTNPVLLVKPKHSGGPKLQISAAPVSHADLMATVMDELSLNAGARYGESVFDIAEDDTRTRRYLYYSWDNSWASKYLPPIHEYTVLPKSNAIESFILTGMYYAPDAHNINQYRFGERIVFTGDSDGTRYFVNGISEVETSFVWSSGKSSVFLLSTGETDKDLICTVKLAATVTEKQGVIISCEGQVLYDAHLTGPETIYFVIPGEYVKNGMLTLNFEYPDAVRPSEISDSKDDRVLAIAFSSIVVDKAE